MTSHASTVFRLILLITVLSYAIHTPASPSNRFLEGTGTTSTNPLLSDHISSLAMNSRYVWVGTGRGVSCYDKVERQWKNFTIMDGLLNNDVLAIALDGEDVWVGTSGGVSRYNTATDEWSRYMPHDGLADRIVTVLPLTQGLFGLERRRGSHATIKKQTLGRESKRRTDSLAIT